MIFFLNIKIIVQSLSVFKGANFRKGLNQNVQIRFLIL